MKLYGEPWVDARPAASGTPIRAFIGGRECALDEASIPVDSVTGFFSLRIPAEESQAGCGVEGAEVMVEVDGRLADQRFSWTAGTVGPVDLVVGRPFTRITGVVELFDASPGEWVEVEPTIDGVVCGEQFPTLGGLSGEFYFYVVVLSEEVSPGCGQPGAEIVLHPVLVSDGGNLRIRLKDTLPRVAWNPGNTIDMPTTRVSR
jgi:hypothetical protein